MASPTDLKERLVFGLLASVARLVPVPLLDDLLREKAIHLMVSRTLKARGRTYASKKVQPLYADNEGCLVGCFLFGLELVLFPIRKILSWVLALKYLAQDLSRAVLLGRVLDRMLEEGHLTEGAGDDELMVEAARIRGAFDNAVRGTDMQLLQGVLSGALGSVSGLPRAALHALRSLRGKGEDASPTEGLSATDQQKVDEGAEKIESALEQPKMQAWLERFDATFDENLRILEARG